jgi:hypothetical protein
MKRLIIFAIILGAIFASCQKVIEYKGEITEPMLYVEALLNIERDTQYVFVGKTKFFLDESYNKNALRDAECFIQYKDGEYQKLGFSDKWDRFFYITPDSVCVGDTFRLMIIHPDFDTIRSSAVVPALLDIYVDTVNYEIIDMGVHLTESKQISTYIDSPLREENSPVGVSIDFMSLIEFPYHETDMWGNTTGVILLDTLGNSAFWCTDPIIADNSFEKYFNLTGEFSDKYKYRYHELLFTTADFSSWPYKLDVILPNNVTAANDPRDETIGVRLNVGMYANDYYSYLRSKYDNDHNQNMFAEPMQLYSNIEGGIGFFGIKKEYQLFFWFKRNKK